MKTKKRGAGKADDDIPTLTEVVMPAPEPAQQLTEQTVTVLQAEISARVLKLAEELTHSAVRDVGAVILESVCDQLRAKLPDLIDDILREPIQKR